MAEVTSLCVLIFFGFVAFAVFRWRRRELYRLAAKIPGPVGWPITGNAHMFVSVRSSEDLEQVLRKHAGDIGSGISKLWICSRFLVVLSEPEYIQTLLNHPSAVSKDELIYGQATTFLGRGIITRNGEKWARLRKPAIKVLHPKSIAEFELKMQKRLDELYTVLDTKAKNGGHFDISHYITRFCFDLLVETGAGVKTINELKTNSLNFPTFLEEALEEATLSSISLLTIFNLNPNFKLKKFGYKLTQISENIMRARLNATTSSAQDENKNCLNIMDLATSVGELEKLNFHETSKLANDFIVAGSDTPSKVIAGVLLMIAIHQDVQERMYQEMKDVFGDSDRPAEKKDLEKMKYLEMVLNEGLRHFGPVLTARRIDSDVPVGSYVLPKGSLVILTQYYVSFNSKFWERPYSFYPEHFTPEANQSRPKGAFLPFNAGPRGCPGKLYAMQVLRNTVSAIVRRYHITTEIEYHQVTYKFHLQRSAGNPIIKLARRL
ncbi:hypothetical protein GE061_009989 [Apolygus lucorum]|uniref:Cytochrome P450 n=1 Tax=Apolygus lucorum TaxID=248454 RepID=A0A8S9Y202_APOLU|nr:hypothetical protein GE061_009989 [Apolygus lucorum]